MMSDHLPECPRPMFLSGKCICNQLRACEARVTAETLSRLMDSGNLMAQTFYAAALDAARDAVAATYDDDHGFPPRSTVLAAIDALR